MAKFGQSSEEHLKTCDPRLQMLFREVVQTYDCSVWEGHREEEAQNLYFRQGKSRLQWPDGPHNADPSKAVHVVPFPFPGWEEKKLKSFYHFAGYVRRVAEGMAIKLRWGGNWDRDTDMNDQSFMDLIHFEVVGE